MTTYKRNVSAWAIVIVGGFASILLTVYVSKWFIAPLAVVVYGSHIVLRRIVCPNCGTPVTYEGEGAWERFRPPSAFLRKRCAKCGWDLNEVR